MITDAIITLLSYIADALLSGLPPTETPAWMSTASAYMPNVFRVGASMGVWFPWSLLGIVMGTVVVVWASAFGIKILRMVLSLFTGGGGSAA